MDEDIDEPDIGNELGDQVVIDDIEAICNSLGKMDKNDGTYMKDRDCKSSLRELQRHLMADSKRHVARLTLGSLNIMKTDMIPLFVQYCDFNDGDGDLFNLILRLCLNLTSSVILLNQRDEDQDEILLHKLTLNLYQAKKAFANSSEIWKLFNVYLKHGVDDEITFERLIILIRNILHIPVDSREEINAHDSCLHQMDKSGMLGTLIHIMTETQKGIEYCFHLTEIFYLILREQNPRTLASARPAGADDSAKKRYAELRARERMSQKMKQTSEHMFRHSSFVIANRSTQLRNPKPVKRILVEKEVRSTNDLDQDKVSVRKARNRKPLSSHDFLELSEKNTSTSKVSYCLKVFTQSIVEKVYNNYMQHMKHNLIQKRTQDNDESYYLWSVQFFTSFARHSNMSLDLVSETLSTSTIHFIQIKINDYQDKLKAEKKKFVEISKRLHLALRAYQELLNVLKVVDSEHSYFKTVETIKKNIFTQQDYSSLIMNLFQQYEERKHSLHYVKDLIITNQAFLDLVENYAQDDEETGDVLLVRYCGPKVIHLHAQMLRKFKQNEDVVNLAILSLFERVIKNCKGELVLFQIIIFKTLIEIVEFSPAFPGYERFKVIACHLSKKFGEMANRKNWLFQELLFWKTSCDADEIEKAVYPPSPLPDEPSMDLPDADIMNDVVSEGGADVDIADLEASILDDDVLSDGVLNDVPVDEQALDEASLDNDLLDDVPPDAVVTVEEARDDLKDLLTQ